MIKSFLVPFRHSLRRGIQYRNSLILTDIPRSANIYLQLNVFRHLEHCFMIIVHMPILTLYMVIFLVQKRFYQVFIIFHYLYHFESFIITHDPSSNYLISFLLQLQRRRSMEFMIHKFIIIIPKDVFFCNFLLQLQRRWSIKYMIYKLLIKILKDNYLILKNHFVILKNIFL